MLLRCPCVCDRIFDAFLLLLMFQPLMCPTLPAGYLVSEAGVGPTEMPRADVRFGCTDPAGTEMLLHMVIGKSSPPRAAGSSSVVGALW